MNFTWFEWIGIALLALVVVGVLVACFERGNCQPKDYPKRWRK